MAKHGRLFLTGYDGHRRVALLGGGGGGQQAVYFRQRVGNMIGLAVNDLLTGAELLVEDLVGDLTECIYTCRYKCTAGLVHRHALLCSGHIMLVTTRLTKID